MESTPELAIGVVEGAPEYELYDVNGSLRLSDHRIVVANSGSRELLYFDPLGRFLRKAGGRGAGPGEFRWLRRICHHDGDSILTLDGAADRISVFSPSGEFARSTEPEAVGSRERPLDAWLVGPFWVLAGPRRANREAVERILRLLPRPDGPAPYRVVLPVQAGRLWVREVEGNTTRGARWTVVDATGQPIAEVTLPPRFDLHEVGEGFVLGRWRDAQDVNYVHLYHLRTTSRNEVARTAPAWLAGGTSWLTDSLRAEQELRQIAATLRSLVMAQEVYFADHRTYADDEVELTLEVPDGVIIDVLAGDRTGHVAAATHPAAPVVCGIGVGTSTPVRWMEGVVTCSRPLPPTP